MDASLTNKPFRENECKTKDKKHMHTNEKDRSLCGSEIIARKEIKEETKSPSKLGLERNGVFPTSFTCMIWKIKSSLVSFQPKFDNPYFLHAWPKLILPPEISFIHESIPKHRKC